MSESPLKKRIKKLESRDESTMRYLMPDGTITVLDERDAGLAMFAAGVSNTIGEEIEDSDNTPADLRAVVYGVRVDASGKPV